MDNPLKLPPYNPLQQDLLKWCDLQKVRSVCEEAQRRANLELIALNRWRYALMRSTWREAQQALKEARRKPDL